MQASLTPIISVRNLSIEFKNESGWARAVDGISFDLFQGESLGLVGESGCGKSVTSLSILGLIAAPGGRIDPKSSIKLNGKELTGLSENDYRKVRGKDVSMIFQDPMTALNPVFTIGNQLSDVIRQHQKLNRSQAWGKSLEMLQTVGIPAPEKRIFEYPHQLSGGMRQRIMIAMALLCGPKVLLADEPTTALDVTTQLQILAEIRRLQNRFKMATLMVTHDLGVIAETCSRVLVMYAGKIVEEAKVADLFYRPMHPYTKGLLNSIPLIHAQKIEKLPVIEGMVPDIANLPKGCRFVERCKRSGPPCLDVHPGFRYQNDHGYACYFPEGQAP